MTLGLLLAALAAVPARAQTRVELEVPALSPSPSVAPSRTLSAPALSTPLLAPLAAPSAAALAAPVAAPAALPAAAVPAAAVAVAAAAAPAAPAASATKAAGGAQDRPERALDQLSALRKELAGGASGERFDGAYMGAGREFAFGADQAERYGAALRAFKAGRADAAQAAALLDAAKELAASAGIQVAPVARKSPRGDEHAGLRVVPLKDGSVLNKLAWDIDRRYGATLEYVPQRLVGAVAAYNKGDSVLFLPDFGRRDAFEAILHESAHAEFDERLASGRLSPFHGILLAYSGRAIAPGASSYVSHMSLEELFTHGRQVKHMLAAARRGGGAEDLIPLRIFLSQYADILRSARLNVGFMKRAAADAARLPVAEGEPDPFPGGKWHVVSLPYSRFYFPVREEEAPKRGALKRLFTRTPETAAQKALRARAEALAAALAELDASVARIYEGANAAQPDVAALNAEADRIQASLRKAEKTFSAP